MHFDVCSALGQTGWICGRGPTDGEPDIGSQGEKKQHMCDTEFWDSPKYGIPVLCCKNSGFGGRATYIPNSCGAVI